MIGNTQTIRRLDDWQTLTISGLDDWNHSINPSQRRRKGRKLESWNGGIRVDEYGIKKKKY